MGVLGLPNGDKVGKRARAFDYSGKVILSKAQYDARINDELERVKKLKNGGEWKKSNRPANTLYADDDICVLKGIGPVKKNSLWILASKQ